MSSKCIRNMGFFTLLMGPIGFSCFTKIRLDQSFNQGYWLSPNIVVLRYQPRGHFSIRVLSAIYIIEATEYGVFLLDL